MAGLVLTLERRGVQSKAKSSCCQDKYPFQLKILYIQISDINAARVFRLSFDLELAFWLDESSDKQTQYLKFIAPHPWSNRYLLLIGSLALGNVLEARILRYALDITEVNMLVIPWWKKQKQISFRSFKTSFIPFYDLIRKCGRF